MASSSTAMEPRACSSQASADHFQQCAEFLPLRNRGLSPLAVTVLPIAFARRGRRYRLRRRAMSSPDTRRPAQSTFRLSSGSSRLYGSM
jgi:hypothetical protein